MNERWLPVPDFEGYQVSDLGRVASVRKVLSPWLSCGYPTVALRRNGTTTRMRVHRLVLLAFVGGGVDLDSRHINGEKTDNRLANLTWGTRSENILDQVRHGRHNNARKTSCPAGHLYSPDNTYVLSGGRRQCKTCTKDQAAASHARRKAAA